MITYPRRRSVALVASALLLVAAPVGAGTAKSNVFTIDLRGPTSLGVSLGSFKVGNLSTKASHLYLWLDATQSGTAPLSAGDFGFRVVSSGGQELARMVGTPWLGKPKAVGDTTVTKFGVELEVVPRVPLVAPGFTDGRLEVSRTSAGTTTAITLPQSEFDLAVWGTDFDMSVDAYPFKNGQWAEGSGLSTDAVKAAKVVWGFVSIFKGFDFWASVGWDPLLDRARESNGLCYGMAASAIARFVHRGDEDYWGEHCPAGSAYCPWEDASENSWHAAIVARDDELDTRAPAWNSPLPTTGSLASASGATRRVELEAFKKILYYHVAQPWFWDDLSLRDEWVSDDELVEFSYTTASSLLSSNRPALFSSKSGSDSIHAIVLIEMARLNGSLSLLFYDNSLYDSTKPVAQGLNPPFLLATVPESNPVTLRGASLMVQLWDSKHTPVYAPMVWAKLLPWDERDSQWIYGSQRPQGVAATGLRRLEAAGSTGINDAERQRLLTRGYARLVLVGAESFLVYPEGSATPLGAVPGGELDGTRVVFEGGSGAFTTAVYLPVAGGERYRVEIFKSMTSPVLMVYEDVPAGGESLDAIGYEDLETGANERTKVVVTVGRGNSSLAATRTSAAGAVDTVAPTFAELATLAVPAVEDLAATREGTLVRLRWVNPVHPGFVGVTVVRTTGGPAGALDGGTVVYEGEGTAASDTPTADAALYYTVFSMSGGPAVASAWVSILPGRPCLTGQVTADGHPVAGASITVRSEAGLLLAATTDASGGFSVCDLAAGRYTVSCEKVGVTFATGAQDLLLGDESMAVAFDGVGVTTLSLTSPTGGERWVIGSTQYIGWSTTGSIPTVTVELSRDEGSSWEALANSVTNSGALVFAVTGPWSTQCLIRVSGPGGEPLAQSATFSIAVAASRSAGVSRRIRPKPPDEIVVTLPGDVPLVLERIPAGAFTMGSPTTERGRGSDETQHQVTITQPFYLGRTEVTQAQWQAVMGTNPANSYGVGADYPAHSVSWNDVAGAGGFIERLNQSQSTTKFRLPTEAEWEFAARAGTTTEFSFTVQANWDTGCGSFEAAEPYMWWCGNNSPSGSKPVGQKRANPWGLSDMHGNVFEWVNDWAGSYPSSPQTDPQGPESGASRVVRGGDWGMSAAFSRSASRVDTEPDYRAAGLGFRLAWSE